MNKEVDINRLNYESYVIDYIDGKLDAVETACFIAFLENNPDIKDEVAELGEVVLVSEERVFAEKANLRKKPIVLVDDINEENYEEYFIAHYEGDLKKTEEDTLVNFLAMNSELNDEFKLHGSLQVEALDVAFEDKKSLKRKSHIGVAWYTSVAAAILLFMASWFFFSKSDNGIRNEIAHLSELSLRNSTVVLSLNTPVEIGQVYVAQQFDNIKQLDNEELIAAREEIVISHLEGKIIEEQLVNSYAFTRFIEQPKNNMEVTPEVLDTELAFADQPTNDNNKGLIARVFSNQISKISKGIKIHRSKRRESSDPTYVKVIDGGLLVFNTITGTESSTVKTYNQDGELTGYQIDGREVMFNGNFADRSSQRP